MQPRLERSILSHRQALTLVTLLLAGLFSTWTLLVPYASFPPWLRGDAAIGAAIAGLATSWIGWLRFGGVGKITTGGTVMLAHGLFFALPATYAVTGTFGDTGVTDVRVTWLSLWVAIMLACGLSMMQRPAVRVSERRPPEASLVHHRRTGLVVGVAVAVASFFGLTNVGTGLVSRVVFFSAAPVVAAAALLAAAIWPDRRSRPFAIAFVVLGASIGLFWFTFAFSGFGRINVAALGLTAAMAWTYLRPIPGIKLMGVCAVPVGIVWGAFLREGATRVSDVLARGEGTTSVFAPFTTTVRILDEGVHYGIGTLFEQLFVSLALPIPREIWSSKPLGFARELAFTLEPGVSAVSGHSMAAGIVGEYVTYLGAIGPLVAVVVVLLHVWAIDRALPTFDPNGSTFWTSVLAIGLSAQTLTLVWGGVQSYWSRGWNLLIGGVVVALAVSLVTVATSRRAPQSDDAQGPDAQG